MNNICVFCSASDQVDPLYKKAAEALGNVLGAEGVRLIYGGASIGLMGILANTVLGAGGEVIGVIPENLQQRELAHQGLSELHVTKTMQERQKMMADLADVFVILPGGLGTLTELTEVMTWKQLNIHDKPIFLLNIGGFWDPLLKTFAHMDKQGFFHGEYSHIFEVFDDIEALQACIIQTKT